MLIDKTSFWDRPVPRDSFGSCGRAAVPNKEPLIADFREGERDDIFRELQGNFAGNSGILWQKCHSLFMVSGA